MDKVVGEDEVPELEELAVVVTEDDVREAEADKVLEEEETEVELMEVDGCETEEDVIVGELESVDDD